MLASRLAVDVIRLGIVANRAGEERVVAHILPTGVAGYASRAIAAAPAPSGTSPKVDDQNGSPSVQIEWEAPPECPNVEGIKAHAERLLGQPLGAPRPQQVVARATMHRNEAGNWELRLSLTSNGRVAEDTLSAKQCTSLGDATALKMALAIDPVATAREIEMAAVETAPRQAPPVPAPVQVPKPAVRPSASPGSFGLRLSVGTATVI